MADYIVSLAQIGMSDLGQVGGKNASLGEMIRHLGAAGVTVPGGFATTADAYHEFLSQSGLGDRIERRLENVDIEDVSALTACGKDIRSWITEAPLPVALEEAVASAYTRMTEGGAGRVFGGSALLGDRGRPA